METYNTAVLFVLQIKRAEVKISTLLAQHNVPLALADHLSPMIRDVVRSQKDILVHVQKPQPF